MSELLPTVQVERVREGLLDYLGTTFSLADEDARSALLEFLEDPATGIFKGPYLRLRLPFRPADDGWRSALGWYEGFPPYGHQGAAFRRLTSADLSPEKPRPLPTLVTTGTGSGKTEAFLHPIVDHVLRAKRAGVTGMKALIVYPMNALANDQAQRLADLLSTHSELAGITAALYTGQSGPQRTTVSAAGLITDRAVIRSSAPDILLTNYKMLDQLLLRHADTRIWRDSAHSLQYLVLDEFHTYDGAQGTDVSMLLRRLGLALKSHWSDNDPAISDDDRSRPLGRITPVATSATLGDRGDPVAMLDFAHTVFGEEFGDDAVVTESRLSLDEWIAPSTEAVTAAGWSARDDAFSARAVVEVVERLPEGVDAGELTEVVASELFAPTEGSGASPRPELLHLFRAHPLTRRLVGVAGDAVPLRELVEIAIADGLLEQETAQDFLLAFVAAMSHLRAVQGRTMTSVELHLWIRELTRIDRAASLEPRYHWFDDGDVIEPGDEGGYATDVPTFPALHCRHCGRSGWGVVLAPTGADLDTTDEDIRRKSFAKDDRFRALILAVAEGEMVALDPTTEVEGLRWFHVTERQFLTKPPDDEAAVREGRVLPVLVHVGEDAGKAAKDDVCPSCRTKDGIRFLGSAIATQLSVALSTLFGSTGLDQTEKKALVFTDSVQDAAHRAGFVQSRSHSLTLRSVLRQAVGTEPAGLDQVVDRVIELAGDDPHRRYRILPPDLADRDEFAGFWRATTLAKVLPAVRSRVRRRLLLDAVLEFGLQSRVGRTLELTGSVAAHVEAPEATLVAAARHVLEQAGGTGTFDGFAPQSQDLLIWARGVLERMRTRGSIEHEWFRKYIDNDGARYFIWGGRPRSQGMPAFPSGRAAPGYPRVGGAKPTKEIDLDTVASPQSWYALWAARVLQLPARDAGVLARLLLTRLVELDVLHASTTTSGAQVFQIPQGSVVVAAVPNDAMGGSDHLLVCDTCQAHTPGSPLIIGQLDGAPCLVARCSGRLARSVLTDNFYRRMYAATEIQRVIAREHTSLLDDETRVAYEDGFKGRQDNPQAPNVLVATPTLEMGIDIGDLSTVMLASLPGSVASYLQRVGRAGRLTGNALNLAFVTGRGEQLPRLGEPLSMINGKVRPPATYLGAEEILRRQYLASVVDRLARREDAPHPQQAPQAIGTVAEGSFLHTLVVEAETDTDGHLEKFLAGFDRLSKEPAEALRAWVTPPAGPLTSPLSVRVHEESHRWSRAVETLQHRITAIETSIPELQQRAESPAATDEDRTAYRTALASLRLTRAQRAHLRGEHWIGVLEEHGLLPNYTLLDDTVALDVSLSWVDADTGEFQSEPYTYERGSALALREFAPGATFYAGGHQILIDAVDLGRDGEAVRRWAFCPSCGFGQDVSETGVKTCPRCGDLAIVDVRQRFDVVELEKVSAAMRRDEAAIDDSRDERVRERFDIVPAADIDAAKVTRQWYIEGYGFGAKHLKGMTIRWLNLGRLAGHGSTRSLAGEDRDAAMFRVCSSCGQLDNATGRNAASEHRPWCPLRKTVEEDTRSVALMRTLTTEGLVLRIPVAVSLGDSFAMPSLAAAVLLGLREHLGGAPDHIAVEAVVDPTLSDGSDNRPALLLHDVVPGGTGYLAELADAETLRSILLRAYEVVRDCPCRDEGRSSCHRCLLPFAGPGGHALVSRVAAERHLKDILKGGEHSDDEPDPFVGWALTEDQNTGFDPETHIEQKFRQVLRERLQPLGATVHEQPGEHGNRLVITLGGTGRIWTLDPQQFVLDSRPDFVLRTNDANVPDVAIFCDGWKYHASPAFNRLADDASKRRNLRDGGYVVLGLSWRDLEPQLIEPPAWLNGAMIAAVTGMSRGALKPSVTELLRGGPMDFLTQWIQAPDPDGLSALADWLPMFMLGRTRTEGVSDGAPIDVEAGGLLNGLSLTGAPTTAWAWLDDDVVLFARKSGEGINDAEVALILSDADERLGQTHADSWRTWLRVANLLNLRIRPTTISVTSSIGRELPAETATELVGDVPESLRVDFAMAGAGQRELMLAIVDAGIEEADYGIETEEGIPVDVAWPARRIAVDLDLTDQDKLDLATAGWTIVSPVVDDITTALGATEG